MELKESIKVLFETNKDEIINAINETGKVAVYPYEKFIIDGKEYLLKTKPRSAKVRKAVRKLQNKKPDFDQASMLMADERIKNAIAGTEGTDARSVAEKAVLKLIAEGKITAAEIQKMQEIPEEIEDKLNIYVMRLFKEIIEVPDELKSRFAADPKEETSVYWELDIESMRALVNSFRAGIA